MTPAESLLLKHKAHDIITEINHLNDFNYSYRFRFVSNIRVHSHLKLITRNENTRGIISVYVCSYVYVHEVYHHGYIEMKYFSIYIVSIFHLTITYIPNNVYLMYIFNNNL